MIGAGRMLLTEQRKHRCLYTIKNRLALGETVLKYTKSFYSLRLSGYVYISDPGYIPSTFTVPLAL